MRSRTLYLPIMKPRHLPSRELLGLEIGEETIADQQLGQLARLRRQGARIPKSLQMQSSRSKLIRPLLCTRLRYSSLVDGAGIGIVRTSVTYQFASYDDAPVNRAEQSSIGSIGRVFDASAINE